MEAAVLGHLWQSTLFVAGAWSLTLALRRYRARTRYWVWLAASVKFLVPFSALASLGALLSPAMPLGIELISQPFVSAAFLIGSPPALAAVEPAKILFGNDFSTYLIVLWALGCAWVLTRWLLSWLRTCSSIRTAAPHRMVWAFNDNDVEVRVSADFLEPGVFGIHRPVLLLPRHVVSRLSAAELDAVVAHEMDHVRHWDNLTAALHMLVAAIFWFHPLVWWIGRQLLQERESACDEAVIAQGAVPRIYAQGILKACRLSLESRLGAVAGASGADLKRRVEAIVRNQPSRRLRVVGRVSLLTVASAVLALPVSAGLVKPQNKAATVLARLASLARFETYSVQPTPVGTRDTPQVTFRDGKLLMRNTSLRELIGTAYGLSERAVYGGPFWLDRPYDIEASAAAPFGEASIETAVGRRMVLRLFEDGFGLRFVERGMEGS